MSSTIENDYQSVKLEVEQLHITIQDLKNDYYALDEDYQKLRVANERLHRKIECLRETLWKIAPCELDRIDKINLTVI